MGDNYFDDSQNFLVLLAQVINKLYLKKLSHYTFLSILLISESTILMVVLNEFFHSLKVETALTSFIGKLSTLLTLELKYNGPSSIQIATIRCSISLLHLLALLAIGAFILNKKSRNILAPYIQSYFYFIFNPLIVLSLSITYFSIYQLKNAQSFLQNLGGPLDVINVILIILWINLVQVFSIEVECKYSQQSIYRIYKYSNEKVKIVRIILSCSFIIFQIKEIFLFITCFSLLIVHLIQLKHILECRKYMNELIQNVTQLISSIWIGCLFVMIITVIFPIPIILDNLGSFFFTVTILFHYSFRICIEYRRKMILINGQSLIRNQDQAISFALELINNLELERFDQSFTKKMFKSLTLENHRLNCEKIDCICHAKNFLEDKQKILKKITEDLLEQICSRFPYSFCLNFIYFGFKIAHSSKLISINHEINGFLKKKNMKNLCFQEKYIVREFQKRIKHHFLEYSRIQNHIKSQNIFLEQSMKKSTYSYLANIIEVMVQKHKLLLLDIYKLNTVEEYSIKINGLIYQMEEIWRKVCEINSFNHELYRLFIFYYQNVIPSQIEGKKITQQILIKLDKLKHLKGFSKDVVNKYIYSRKSCVIESNFQEQFGVITNISRYCYEVLGAKKEEIINTDIHEIMPEYFARSHQEVLNIWLQNCTVTQCRTDLSEFGYVDLNQICFQGFVSMKIFPGENKLLYYTVLIRQNDNDYLLLNSNLEIEGIGKRLIKQEIFTTQHFRHSMTEYSDFNFHKKLAQSDKVRGKIFLQNVHTARDIQMNTDELITSSKVLDKSKQKYDCNVFVSKHRISKEFYYLIKFENVTRWISSPSTEYFKQLRFGSKKLDDDKAPKTMKMIDDELIAIDDYESVEPVTNNIRFTQLLNLSVRNSSLSSNALNEAAYYNHFVKNIKKMLINPSFIPLVIFKKASFILLIISILLVIEFFSLRKLFVVGFDSFNNVMFGDGAVSDNNQILEIMYNDVLMSRVYCSASDQHSARCQYLLNSTAAVSNILYDLYLSDVEAFLQNKTALSELKYYASYEIKVPFSLGDSVQEVSTLQFMEYFYAAVKRLHREITVGRGFSGEADEAMQILLDNWQAMKFVNHNAIYFYLAAGEKELEILMGDLLILGAALFICTFALGVVLKKYYDYQLSKKINILSLHSYMNNLLLKDLTDYYLYLKEIVTDLKFIPQKFDQSPQHMHQENKKLMKYDRNKMCLVQIILLVLVISALGGIQILQISLVLPSSIKMVNVINDLMDSENYLLQNYFELKTYYLAFNYSKSVDQISQEISMHLNQTQPLFVGVAKDSLDLFAADPTFTNDFNTLLIADACQLTKWLFEPWQAYYCFNNLTTSVLSLGLVNGMTFFQRNAYEALNQLQKRQHEKINTTEYFMQDVFKDIDDSIFYMFRLYQATQARMYQGLNYSVNSSLLLLDVLNICSACILSIVMLWWFKNLRNQQKQISNLYGVVLQLPECIMKAEVIARVRMSLEIDH